MKSDEERRDLNQILIPRDIGDLTKKRRQLYGRAGLPTRTAEGVAPTYLGSSTEESKIRDQAAAPEEGTTQNSAADTNEQKNNDDESVTGEKYQKAYIKKRRRIKAEQKEEQKKLAVKNAQEQQKQLEIDTNFRNQAREIQNQMRMWENKRNEPASDSTQIDAMISVLQSQLNGIDPKYWY